VVVNGAQNKDHMDGGNECVACVLF